MLFVWDGDGLLPYIGAERMRIVHNAAELFPGGFKFTARNVRRIKVAVGGAVFTEVDVDAAVSESVQRNICAAVHLERPMMPHAGVLL